MPSSGAGILGISSGEVIGGIKIDAKIFVIAVAVFLLLEKLLGIVIRILIK